MTTPRDEHSAQQQALDESRRLQEQLHTLIDQIAEHTTMDDGQVRRPIHVRVRATEEERQETREFLESVDVPTDAPLSDTQSHLDPADLTESSVQPSAGVLNELRDHGDQRGVVQTDDNSRDSGADVLPT